MNSNSPAWRTILKFAGSISLPFFAGFFLAACSSGTESSTNASRTFLNNELFLSANVDYAVRDTAFTIRMECFPFYDGKGRFVLQVLNNNQTVKIESPLDTLIGSLQPSNACEFPFEFDSRETAVLRWDVQLLDHPSNYSFEGYATIDSIWIEDSLVYINSEAALNAAPFGDRFQNAATAREHLFLPAR